MSGTSSGQLLPANDDFQSRIESAKLGRLPRRTAKAQHPAIVTRKTERSQESRAAKNARRRTKDEEAGRLCSFPFAIFAFLSAKVISVAAEEPALSEAERAALGSQ